MSPSALMPAGSSPGRSSFGSVGPYAPARTSKTLQGISRMLLRNRNTNTTNEATLGGKPGDLPVKRAAGKQLLDDKKGEPKAKRAALTELSNAISSVLIDSSKKVKEEPKRSTRRCNSVSELEIIAESPTGLSTDPAPHYDYDQECMADNFSVPEYAFDIFKYYKWREIQPQFTITPYLARHPKISGEERALVIDWMNELQETFELNHETLYLSVKLFDLFLSRTSGYSRQALQLIASSAMFIASKFDERYPPLVDDFIFVSEDSFKRSDLEEMEMKMLKTVRYDLGIPLSYRFLRRYARASKTDMATLTLARYILETSLTFYEFVFGRDSHLAAGALLLAQKMKNQSAEWTPILHKYSGYKADEVEKMADSLNHMLHVRTTGKGYLEKLKTAFVKYSHEVFYKSTEIPLLPDKHTGRPVVLPL